MDIKDIARRISSVVDMSEAFLRKNVKTAVDSIPDSSLRLEVLSRLASLFEFTELYVSEKNNNIAQVASSRCHIIEDVVELLTSSREYTQDNDTAIDILEKLHKRFQDRNNNDGLKTESISDLKIERPGDIERGASSALRPVLQSANDFYLRFQRGLERLIQGPGIFIANLEESNHKASKDFQKKYDAMVWSFMVNLEACAHQNKQSAFEFPDESEFRKFLNLRAAHWMTESWNIAKDIEKEYNKVHSSKITNP